MDDENMNYERAKIFCDKEMIVHVSKKDGAFYNGIIFDVTPDFFFIMDREDGKKLVFFKELNKPIEEYREEKLK